MPPVTHCLRALKGKRLSQPPMVVGEWQIFTTDTLLTRHCDGYAYLLSVAVYLCRPKRGLLLTYYTYAHVAG